MTIPQATLDTITSALKAEGLSGQLEPPVTPTEEIQKSLARHADKEAVWYADASLVTPAAKRNIMKALGSLGAAVTAYGVLVPIPTDASGAGETVNNSGDGVSELAPAPDSEAEGAVVEAAPEATPEPERVETPPEPPAPYNEPADVDTSVSVADGLVATASVDATPVKPRIETIEQRWIVGANEQRTKADAALNADGIKVLNVAAAINTETLEYVRVVTLERAA